MKLTAITVLLALNGEVVSGLSRRKLNFIRKMRESEKVNGPIRMSKPSLAAFLEKSQQSSSLKGSDVPKVSKEELERRLNYYNNYEKYANDKLHRKLEDQDPAYEGGQYSNNYNSNYNQYNANNVNANNNNAWYNKVRHWFSRNNETAAWYNNTAQEMYGDADNTTYNLDGLADLSIKYAGCSSTTSFTSEVEDDDSSHFIAETLVQYRLCPAESCQDNSWQGCKSEYGEYMMTLEDFLDSQSDLLEEEFKMICQYCDNCYNFNDGGYCDNGNCCTHTHDCEDYDETCFGDQQDEEDAPDYEDLFDCMEVDMSGYSNDDQFTTGYVGVHCNGLHIEVGLFSDSSCTHLVLSEDQADIASLTGVDFNTEELEQYYVPEGCLTCGGEDYNWKGNWWYVEADKDEENDDDYVNEVCATMYESSAKCNENLADDIQEALEDNHDEDNTSPAVTCNFIKDAILGHIDENGFVYAHNDAQNNNPVMGFWNWATNAATEDPQYIAQGAESSDSVTAAQATALTLGAIGVAAMATVAYMLKQQVDQQEAAGLIPNEDKQID